MKNTASIARSISINSMQKEKLLSLLQTLPDNLQNVVSQDLGNTISEIDNKVLFQVAVFREKIFSGFAVYQGMILGAKDISDERKKELVEESLEWKKKILEGIDGVLSS